MEKEKLKAAERHRAVFDLPNYDVDDIVAHIGISEQKQLQQQQQQQQQPHQAQLLITLAETPSDRNNDFRYALRLLSSSESAPVLVSEARRDSYCSWPVDRECDDRSNIVFDNNVVTNKDESSSSPSQSEVNGAQGDEKLISNNLQSNTAASSSNIQTMDGSKLQNTATKTACGDSGGKVVPVNGDSVGKVVPVDTTKQDTPEVNNGYSVSPEVLKERDLNKASLTDTSSTSSRSNNKSERKKKTSSWYNVLAPTYKSRCEEFKRLFKDVGDEKLVVDYSCALQKDILVHGRLYITKNCLCFYANIFKWETLLTIRFKDIVALTKEKTARVIPNAVQVCTKDEKYFFTSFNSRDKTHVVLLRLWQLAINDQPLSNSEFNQLVHQSYGDQLGLTSSDEEDILHGHSRNSSYDPLVNGADNKLDNGETVNGGNRPIPYGLPPDNLANINDGETVELLGTMDDGDDSQHTLSPSLAHPLATSSPVNGIDLPTDHGDTSEEEGEISCTGHSHGGLLVLDDVFPVNVDTLFEFLFTDSPFYTELCCARKWTDISLQPWANDSNLDGIKTRNISYTLPLNYSIGPKTSAMKEKQICLSESKVHEQYVVDCECTNQGVPYSDSFNVHNRYCMTRVSAQLSRLKVHSEIKYKKNVWGLVKTFIDRNVTQGVTDSFNFLGDFIRQACAQVNAPAAAGNSKKRLFKRRHRQTSTSHTTSKPSDDVIGETKNKGQIAKEEFYIRLNLDILVRVIAVVLMALVLVNAILFYKLTSMEKLASSIQQQHPHDSSLSPTDHRRQVMETESEWSRLLTEQQRLQQTEVEKWRQVLMSSIQLVEQMQRALRDLHDGVLHRSDDLDLLSKKLKQNNPVDGETQEGPTAFSTSAS